MNPVTKESSYKGLRAYVTYYPKATEATSIHHWRVREIDSSRAWSVSYNPDDDIFPPDRWTVTNRLGRSLKPLSSPTADLVIAVVRLSGTMA